MSVNVPTTQHKRYSFGPGVVYIGPVGSTPTVEIGSVKGDSELNIERSRLEVLQGSPQTRIKSYAVEEKVSIKFTGIEWNLDNLAYALGAGETSLNGAEEVFEFGGDVDTSERALRFVHIQPDGSTIDIHLFKAEGNGTINVALKETDIHEFPYEFFALEASTDFTGAALADKKKKFKIIRTIAA